MSYFSSTNIRFGTPLFVKDGLMVRQVGSCFILDGRTYFVPSFDAIVFVYGLLVGCN